MLIWECSQAGLEPGFLQDIKDLLTPSTWSWHVMYGFRSLELQAKLYAAHLAGGPLAAPPGKSAHNFGLAVDLQLIVAGKQEWNVKSAGWQWLFNAIIPTPRLHSGIGFGDFDHIERVNWKAFKDWNKQQQIV